MYLINIIFIYIYIYVYIRLPRGRCLPDVRTRLRGAALSPRAGEPAALQTALSLQGQAFAGLGHAAAGPGGPWLRRPAQLGGRLVSMAVFMFDFCMC